MEPINLPQTEAVGERKKKIKISKTILIVAGVVLVVVLIVVGYLVWNDVKIKKSTQVMEQGSREEVMDMLISNEITELASSLGDISFCERISNNRLKEECISTFFNNYSGLDLQWCSSNEPVSGDTALIQKCRLSVINNKALREDNVVICKELLDYGNPELDFLDCQDNYYSIKAMELRKEDMCASINNSNKRKGCLEQIRLANNGLVGGGNLPLSNSLIAHTEMQDVYRGIISYIEGLVGKYTGEKSILLFNLSKYYELVGDTEMATINIRRATDIDPNNAELWSQLGSLLVSQEDWGGAELAFRKSIDLDPAQPVRYLNLAKILFLFDKESALSVINQGISTTGDNWILPLFLEEYKSLTNEYK